MKKISITREILNLRTNDKSRQFIFYSEDGYPGFWYKGFAKDFKKEKTAQEIIDEI